MALYIESLSLYGTPFTLSRSLPVLHYEHSLSMAIKHYGASLFNALRSLPKLDCFPSTSSNYFRQNLTVAQSLAIDFSTGTSNRTG